MAASLVARLEDVTIEHCTSAIENFMFPVLYNKMQSSLGCEAQDKEILVRIR